MIFLRPLILSQISFLAQSFTIPVHRCANRVPCIDIIANNTRQRALLSLGNHYLLNSTFIDTIAVEFASSQIYEYSTFYSGNHELPTIGVGLSSPITRAHGSVALIKHQQASEETLVFGLSENQFNATCVPESIIILSLDEPEWMVDGTVKVVSVSGHVFLSEIEPFFADIYSTRHELHYQLIEPIFGHFQNFMVNDTIFNCSLELMETAPLIQFSFGDQNVPAIFLYPEDYLDFNPSTNSCTFLFSRTDSVDMWGFAPFNIPQANVFVNNQSLYICDSIV